MANRSRSGEGNRKNTTPRASSQERAYTASQLQTLRLQLGTAELAKRMGIPAPSLRRLLGKGKSAGMPRNLMALEAVKEQVRASRRKPEIRLKDLAGKAARKAEENGTLDLEYMAIAKRYQMSPKEVYTMGKSPGALGESL